MSKTHAERTNCCAHLFFFSPTLQRDFELDHSLWWCISSLPPVHSFWCWYVLCVLVFEQFRYKFCVDFCCFCILYGFVWLLCVPWHVCTVPFIVTCMLHFLFTPSPTFSGGARPARALGSDSAGGDVTGSSPDYCFVMLVLFFVHIFLLSALVTICMYFLFS